MNDTFSNPPTSPAFAPATGTERLLLPDTLRGLALFGILMVNMASFQWPMSHHLLQVNVEGCVDQFTWSFIRLLFEGKFYVMFSVLFGLGFWQLMEKTEEGQRSKSLSVFRRRIAWLLSLGILHISLLWPGDILLIYGLAGLILMPFRKLRTQTLFVWLILFALIPTVVVSIFAGLIGLASLTPEGSMQIQAMAAQELEKNTHLVNYAIETYRQGTFLDMMAMRWIEYAEMFVMVLIFIPAVLAWFLLGVIAGRTGFFSKNLSNEKLTRTGLKWGFGLGIILNILYLYSYQNADFQVLDFWTVLFLSTHTFGGFFLAWGYVSLIRWLMHRDKFKSVFSCLAKVGRMSLTNYLMQSLICAFVFTNYGFSLIGRLSYLQGAMLVLLIFTFQIAFSLWWMSRFRYGPMEWLGRWFAYEKRPAMRLADRPD